MHIRDTTFVVVDTETTGTRAQQDRIIEIAAVKVRGGEIVDEFAQLINPERSVPYRISRITGITTGMVFDQPVAADVLPRFLEFLGDGVFVAHNLTFDLRFVNAELERAGLPELDQPTLCTLRLARRLLRGLRSKGLSSVTDFYGIKVNGRHRALGDAAATAEVLRRFVSQLEFEHDVATLQDLLHFQHAKYSQIKKAPQHVRKIRDEILPRLPDRPGVYFMKDRNGGVIYIGKAKSLRSRVRSYFTAIEAHPERTLKLVQAVRDVAWTETGSELSALLLESRLIKEHKPRFNRAQRRYRNRPFVRLDTTHPIPRVTLSPYLEDDGAEYFGPLGGRRQGELVVDVINRTFKLRECDDDTYRMGRRCLYGSMGRCLAPCVQEDPEEAYAREVERVRAFLMGRDRSVLALIEEEMKAASARLDFEEAKEYRDWYRRLERMLNRQENVAAPVLRHDAVIVQPGVAPDTAQLFLVRFGRLAETLVVSNPLSVSDEARLAALLQDHFDAQQARPERYFKKEVDEIRLLAHWMYVNRDQTDSVRWDPERSVEAFVAAIAEKMAERSQIG